MKKIGIDNFNYEKQLLKVYDLENIQFNKNSAVKFLI